nr:D-alanyl-D-alanine carboxypeptidase family protein [uncultured Blautia sp.]
MKRHAVNVLLMILQKISAGNAIVPVSGYRSAQEQTAIYDDSLKENGEEFTRKFVALPNHSEHQTGLAIDLGLNKEDIDFICPDFPYAGICNDFRYVGCPHSLIMKDRGFSLEEYTDFIKAYRENSRFVYKQADGKETEVYYVPANDGEIQLNIPESSVYQVSGNNVDGFIVTVWRDNDERKKVLYRY